MSRKPSPHLVGQREAALKSERLAARKAAAMAKGPMGYDVRGTALDPRVGEGAISRMTSRQLDQHMAKLQYFRSRRVGWVADANGNPMSRQVYNNTINAIKANNRRVQAYKDSVKNIKIPWRGVTAGEYDQEWRPKKAYLESGAGYVMQLRRENISSRAFLSEAAAHKYAAMLLHENTASAQKERVNAMRKQFSAMAATIGDSELKSIAANVSDKQMWFAWVSDRELADAASLTYDIVQHLMNDTGRMKPSTYVQVGSTQLGRVKEILRDAAKVKVP